MNLLIWAYTETPFITVISKINLSWSLQTETPYFLWYRDKVRLTKLFQFLGRYPKLSPYLAKNSSVDILLYSFSTKICLTFSLQETQILD